MRTAERLERAQIAVARVVSEYESELRSILATLRRGDEADAIADVLSALGEWKRATEEYLSEVEASESDLSADVREHGDGRVEVRRDSFSLGADLVFEASEIGLRPGQWPPVVEIVNRETRAATRFIRAEAIVDAAHSFAGYAYRVPVGERRGARIDILND